MGSYTDEEAREILRRAIESHEVERQGLTHDDLVQAAREVGIEADAVDRAAIEVREQAAVEMRRKERRVRERHRLAGSVVTYAVVNGFLALLDWMTGGGWWVQWPMLIWGFFLVMQMVQLVSPRAREQRDERAERRYQRQLAREARRRARQEARRRRVHAGEDFERAVEQGVAALLSAAARHLGELIPGEPERGGDGELRRYIESRSGRTPGGEAAAGAPPRARVGEERPEPEVAEQEARVARRKARPS